MQGLSGRAECGGAFSNILDNQNCWFWKLKLAFSCRGGNDGRAGHLRCFAGTAMEEREHCLAETVSEKNTCRERRQDRTDQNN